MADTISEQTSRFLSSSTTIAEACARTLHHGTHAAPGVVGSVLATVLLAGTASAVAQEGAPVVVEREGAAQVRAGERFEYQLKIRNQSEVPVKDVKIDEFVPPTQGQQAQGQQEQQDQDEQDQQQAQSQQDQKQAQTQQDQQQAQGQQDQQQAQDEQGQQQAQGRQGQQTKGQQKQKQQRRGEYGISRTIPYLAPGDSETITVSGVARKEGELRSCIAVEYVPATCTGIEVVKPDISLSCDMQRPEGEIYQQQDLAANAFYACDQVTITCRVKNEGSGATRPAELSFALPSGLKPAGDGEATMQVDSIEPGESSEATIQLAAQQGGEYELQPSLSTDEGEMTAEPLMVRVLDPQLELAVQAPSEDYLNRPVSYTVNLRNPGDVPVPRTRLSIDSPAKLENVSVSSEDRASDDGSYDIGMLRPGDSRSIQVTGDATEAGEATLSATAEGYCVQAKEKMAKVQLKGVPALVLVAYDNRDPVAVGNETVYDIKVRNQGSAAADNIELEGKLGQQLTFVEGSGQTKVTGSGTSFQLAPVKKLEPGQSAAWTVTVKGESEGYGRLDLDMKSSATKRSVTEQEPTRVIQ